MMDASWIDLCRKGDALAIERLVCAYQQVVFRLALSILDDPAEAEDATQEAFLSAIIELPSFHGASTFTTWLYAITINACRTRLRRRKARGRLTQVIQGLFKLNSPAPVEELVVENETDTRLWNAIQAIDERHRLPIILRYYHGLSVAEISETLGIPQGTVHSRLNHAREFLRVCLKEGQT